MLLAQARRSSPLRLRLSVFQSNTSAIEFYAGRGFGILESTDGTGNEEQTPDHLMQWVAASG